MSELNKFGDIIVQKPENPINVGDDPDATRKEELKRIKHQNSLWFYKSLPWLIKGLLLFLFILFFGILPISEMSLSYSSVGEVVKDWCRAFLNTSKTIGIALATLIVSDLLKRIFDYAKEHVSEKE